MIRWIVRFTLTTLWVISIIYMYGLGAIGGQFMPTNPMIERSTERSLPLAMWLAELSPGAFLCEESDTQFCGFNDTSDKFETSCAPFTTTNPRNAVLFVLGQSNSANSGSDRYSPRRNVINFNPHDGNCYKSDDPLLGPDSEGGSVWNPLADRLIESGQFERVLIVPIGIGGTEIARWRIGGDLNRRIGWAAKQLTSLGIRPTHVLWHQGESDTDLDTLAIEYTVGFGEVVQTLRNNSIYAPIYAAIATHCNQPTVEIQAAREESIKTIRAAQLHLSQKFDGVFPGPDTDQIKGSTFRFDGCHFNHRGMAAHADLWLEALQDN